MKLGFLFPLGCISWLLGAVAIALGIYLYNQEENLLGGVIAGCNPANGKLLTVGIPGVVMWLSAVSCVVRRAGTGQVLCSAEAR